MKRQTAWIVTSRTLGAGLQAALLILLARSIGPAEFGVINAALGIFTFLGLVVDFGLTNYSIRAISIENKNREARTALWVNYRLSISYGVLGIVVLVSCVAVIGIAETLTAIGLLLWVIFEKLNEAESAFFFAKQIVLPPAVTIVLRRLVAVLLFVTLSSVFNSSVVFAVSIAFGGLIGLLYISRARRKAQTELRLVDWRAVLKDAIPYWLTSTFTQTKTLDFAIIGAISTATDAGGYAAASRLAAPVHLLTSAIATAVMPAVGHSGRPMARRIVVLLILGSVILLALCTILWPFSDTVMAAIFGNQYREFGPVLVLVLSATLLNAVQSPLSSLLQALGAARVVAIYSVVFGIALLALVAMGAQAAGALGASVGYMIATTTGTCCLGVLSWRWSRPQIQ